LSLDIQITRAQNRNYALGDGFHRMAKQGNAFTLLLRYKAQTERLYRRAVEEFDRLKALRPELRNEAISEVQPEENESAYIPPDEPVSNPQSNPQPPATDPKPEKIEQEILPAATSPRWGKRSACRIAGPSARRRSRLKALSPARLSRHQFEIQVCYHHDAGRELRENDMVSDIIIPVAKSSWGKLLSVVILAISLAAQTSLPAAEYNIYAGSTHAHTAYTWSHGDQFSPRTAAPEFSSTAAALRHRRLHLDRRLRQGQKRLLRHLRY